MGRPRKIIESVVTDPKEAEMVVVPIDNRKFKIAHLSLDYPSEGLNNMAMKINEVIETINRQ